jgi:hypothetical protein
VEIKEHKNDHDYKIMDYMSFPLFEEGWGADEELLLLEAIQMYAFSIHASMTFLLLLLLLFCGRS